MPAPHSSLPRPLARGRHGAIISGPRRGRRGRKPVQATQAFELSPHDIRIIGSTATYRGTETLKLMNGERLVTSTRGVNWVFIRGKGPHGWQVVARQNWPIPAAKPS